jgi:predicted unusual protein kinase regulating ubiquinone biosynthesis (AarF/ABC1/UbiB family)
VTHQHQRTAEEIQQDLHRELGQLLHPDGADGAKINRKRFRKVRWFFAKAFIQIIFWDIVLNRPVLRWLRRSPLPRWQKIARNFRLLAVEMGGVLIKLGQFLSIRVDILPTEVTSELAGLQDEVPAEKLAAILAQVEADFDRPVSEVFPWFSPQPVGAASLSQVHLARLASGEEVVVKVMRPGIEVLVETDLSAIALAIRWLKFYKRIAKRVDLDWLAEEFTSVTRNELDFKAEGQHAEHFARDFADDPQVYIPKVHWEYCAPHTLTLENVGFIKIGDLAAIEAAGISRAQLAKKFYQIYMRQIFMTNFVHADPHPGNVFVRPLPHPDEAEITEFGPNDAIPPKAERSFQVVFIDFGMVAVIPERLRAALREYAIGVGTRDAHKIVQAYVNAGVLLPGADLKRLEEAHEAMFERFWGVRMGQMQSVALSEARYFLREYRDVIYDAPFQFQVDMLFVMRAVGILSGMATNLDPEFDPWAETIPFAERLAKEELQQNWRGWLQEALNFGQLIFRMPAQLERVLTLAQRGNLVVQTSLAPDARKSLQRVEQAINRLTWAIIAASLLLAGVSWSASHPGDNLGPGLLILALLVLGWGILKG